MNQSEIQSAFSSAQQAAREAGELLRRHLHAPKKANFISQHDIKLELDLRCQRLIEGSLARHYPQIAVLGEESETGEVGGLSRWVVDPIDGTVNFACGIPHACVSIALQAQTESKSNPFFDGYETMLGVVYDPFLDEMWTATRDETARLNGKTIRASQRGELEECILAMGFSKTKAAIDRMLPGFGRLLQRVRKMRILGAAALSLCWVAAGRMDAFVESGVCLWDIAAGGLILERAGGDFHCNLADKNRYKMIANNGLLREKIAQYLTETGL